MRLVAGCVFFTALVALVHPECYVRLERIDAWAGSEINQKESFAKELVESAFHGLDEREYTSERFNQFVQDRMDRCFPQEIASWFTTTQPAVYRISWNVKLCDAYKCYFPKENLAARRGLRPGYSLGHIVYSRGCSYWYGRDLESYILIEQRITAKIETAF